MSDGEHGDDDFECAPCGYVVLDATGTVDHANREFLRMVGRRRDEVVQKLRLSDLVTVGGRIYFQTHLSPILHVEGVVREVALDLLRPDGTRVAVLVNANRTQEPGDPSSARIRVILMEAKDRRRYEVDLLNATHAAEAARLESTELAQALQQTLIPPEPPRIEGLVVAGAYRPAGDGSVVGGDFYDVFQVAEHEWLAVVGDVRGKGIGAATVTSYVRHTLRDLAMQVHDPAELLRRLDVALTGHPSERFCTVVVARLICSHDGWTVLGSVGGHPLPLVRRPDGTVEEIGQPGSLVGIIDDPRFVTFEHDLSEGLLLLYTDGVVEARRGGELYGEGRLRALVADGAEDVHGLTAALVESVLEFQHDDAQDDIAVLAFQLAPE